ncbi:MAG: DUF5615 family PIN-like protein [Hyphomicrobiaceae bacterium]
MKIKLDENIGLAAAAFLRAAEHDVAMVRDQGLAGAPDDELFSVCAKEKRILIPFDRDFGHILRFPPHESAGIVVLDVVGRASPAQAFDRNTDV